MVWNLLKNKRHGEKAVICVCSRGEVGDARLTSKILYQFPVNLLTLPDIFASTNRVSPDATTATHMRVVRNAPNPHNNRKQYTFMHALCAPSLKQHMEVCPEGFLALIEVHLATQREIDPLLLPLIVLSRLRRYAAAP
jgi:hypothetical protein